MKRCILKIYKADLKKIFTNWVSMVVLGGLILLPSLYAWVNILASWDPYGNTNGVKVGIVNEDKGGKIGEKEINIGEELITTLKENKKLGWTFYEDRKEGIAAASEGDVYAVIIIPEEFSREMVTVIDPEPIKPKLEYYVNEKINAIAPKMTDSGASTLQREISTSFIETATEKVFELLNEAGIKLEKEYPTLDQYKNMLFDFNDKMPKLSGKLENLEEKTRKGVIKLDEKQEDIVYIQDMLEDMSVFVDGVEKDLVGANERLKKEAPEISNNLTLLGSIFGNISTLTADLSEDIITGKPEYIQKLEDARDDIGTLENKLDDVVTQVDKIDENLSKEVKSKVSSIKGSLGEYSDLLWEIRNNLNNTDKLVKLLKTLSETNTKISATIGELKNIIDTGFKEIEDTLQGVSKFCQDVAALINKLQKPDSGTTGEEINPILKNIDALQEKVKANSQAYGQLADQLQGVKDTLKYLQELLGQKNDPNNPNTNTGGIIDKVLTQLQNQLLAASTTADNLRNIALLMHNNALQGTSQVQTIFAEIAKITRQVSNDINYYTDRSQEKLVDIADRLDEAGRVLGKTSEKIIDSMGSLGEGIQSVIKVLTKNLDEAQELTEKLQQVLEDESRAEEILSQFSILMGNMQRLTERMDQNLDTILIPKVDGFVLRGSNVTQDVKVVLDNLNESLNNAKDILNNISEKGEVAIDDIQKLQKNVPEMQERLNDLTEKVKTIDSKLNVKDLVDLFTQDHDKRVDFFAYPVNLETNKLFPMANYGAAMTPFYSTLSLWVGALLLSALLTTKSKNVDFEYNTVQEFFGKFLLFGSAAMLQGLIVALGDVFILKVEMLEPLLFIALAPFYSLVFTMIVYTLVSLFGNVGKAIGVILLVLQLAASGGTFPIQVTPPFFQRIYAMLPFTYAISGMREAIAGVVYHTLVRDIAILIGFFIGFMILGVLLKKLANKFLAGFQHKLGESGIIEH